METKTDLDLHKFVEPASQADICHAAVYLDDVCGQPADAAVHQVAGDAGAPVNDPTRCLVTRNGARCWNSLGSHPHRHEFAPPDQHVAPMEKKYHVTNAEWIALTFALEATPDISMRSLTQKAKRLVESRKKYAQEVVKLEGKLLEKCPELEETSK